MQKTIKEIVELEQRKREMINELSLEDTIELFFALTDQGLIL